MTKTDAALQTPAYVLHRRPYREHDLLVDIFSFEHGRLRAVARRAQSRRSQLKALLQPFYPLNIQLSGQRELKTLISAEAAGPMLQLPGEQLYGGLYLNELLIRALGQLDPYPELFAAYSAALERLAAEQKSSMEPVLRSFELCLLEQLGYGIDFNQVAEAGHYCYVPDHGLRQSAPESYGSMPGSALLAIAEGKLDDLSTARHLLRAALKPLLGNKPLQSRELLIQTRRLRGE